MTKPYNTDRRVERSARLTWVALGLMRYPTMAQRDKINQGRVSMIAANMDLEQLGTPTVNKRHGQYHVLDGMHRVEAYKLWIGDGWENQQLQCWTYTDLTETEEAEVFLKLNDTLAIPAFDRFRIGLNAGRLEETEIAAVVAKVGLTIAKSQAEGAIGAVGALRRVYRREGDAALARSLELIRDAYGTAGLDAKVIDGIGLLCGRYNGDLDMATAVTRLASVSGGLAGLMNRAAVTRNQTNAPLATCIAAAAVELINRGRGGTKLPAWWKSEPAAQDKAS
jgi:hypothetical protein